MTEIYILTRNYSAKNLRVFFRNHFAVLWESACSNPELLPMTYSSPPRSFPFVYEFHALLHLLLSKNTSGEWNMHKLLGHIRLSISDLIFNESINPTDLCIDANIIKTTSREKQLNFMNFGIHQESNILSPSPAIYFLLLQIKYCQNSL